MGVAPNYLKDNCMDFINFLIREELEGVALNSYKTKKGKKREMGLVLDPDDEEAGIKNTRYNYGGFLIQPPVGYSKLSPKKRAAMFRKMKKALEVITESVEAINNRDLGVTFTAEPDKDRSKCIIRLIDDHDNEYAAMYQQEDDDNDGAWERGDFIYNISAKNANIHTFCHESGHKFFYEVLTDKQAEDWQDYYKLRKYRDKMEFVTKYAKDNHREDFAETFAIYILGKERIDKLYDKMRVSKHEDKIQSVIGKFKKIVFDKSNTILNPPKIKPTKPTKDPKQEAIKNIMKMVK